jgi:hypothetical protein
MNFRTTAILFGTVLAFGVILLVLNLTDEETAPTGAIVEELASAGLKADDVDTIVE